MANGKEVLKLQLPVTAREASAVQSALPLRPVGTLDIQDKQDLSNTSLQLRTEIQESLGFSSEVSTPETDRK
ncbi:hypothetical protein D4764_19G0006440 [Takifugu flavidus]|uniref:Uncharacterized protein n=1 Tax=Takifugu flavidus TaxID=433684 RepID=A0A5C6NP74_9TELE|nr:hypothetical protein D4764_19G0006440 [Takifugu flavidus]